MASGSELIETIMLSKRLLCRGSRPGTPLKAGIADPEAPDGALEDRSGGPLNYDIWGNRVLLAGVRPVT